MFPMHAFPLERADLLRLDRFLRSAACGSDAMGLSRAHGFLTAAASGPEGLAPDEWIRLVFDEPVFASGEQAQEMLGLAMRLYRDIEAGLRVSGGFRPVLEYLGDGEGAPRVDAHAWCEGFLSGMRLFREHWTGAAQAMLQEPLEVISRLARMRPARDGRYARLCEALPLAAEVIYLFWREEQARPA
jgi:uncharacterized protein